MPPRSDLSPLEWRMKSGARYTDSRLNWASLSRSGGTATETSVRKARPPEAARNRVGKELVKGARLPVLAASSKKRPRLCAGGEEFGVHEGTRSPCGRAERVLTLAAGLRR